MYAMLESAVSFLAGGETDAWLAKKVPEGDPEDEALEDDLDDDEDDLDDDEWDDEDDVDDVDDDDLDDDDDELDDDLDDDLIDLDDEFDVEEDEKPHPAHPRKYED
jgi:ribonuclease E